MIPMASNLALKVDRQFEFQKEIDEISRLNWSGLSEDDLTGAAWAYYYFSIQFRESLGIGRLLHPADEKLRRLEQEECNTDNLSPWPGVASIGEKMNHDEFMRRLLKLSSISAQRRCGLEEIGQAYLVRTRKMDPVARGLSIASYEDGGLESVFRAMLQSPHWDTPLLRAFKHFLTEHIRFDNEPGGHGTLSRHLTIDDQILPLWTALKNLFVESVPRLSA